VRAVTGAIVAAGLVGAVLVVVLSRSGSTPTAAGATTSAGIAAPPSFGASLPISASGAAAPSGSAASAAAPADAELTEPSSATAVLAAAQNAIATVDSYDFRHLDKNRAAGDAVSTGGFRTRYDSALRALAATAGRTKTVQQAVVQKIALTSLSGDTAGVLVFGRIETTTASDPAGTTSDLASGVTLQRTGGAWRISDTSDLVDRGTFVATPPGNAALVDAVTAGAHEVVNLLSYSRANFTADFDRALAGLTKVLQAQQLSRRAGLFQAMNQSQSDYAGQVRAVGIESASGTSALLLVLATGYLVSASQGAQPLSGTERFEVGVEFVHGRWLVSEYLALPSAS
jgi:hypothetical protein